MKKEQAMNVHYVVTKFGEMIDLEELDITLASLIPPCVSIVVYFASKAAFKDSLGPRIYLKDGDPYAPFDIHQVYPVFLNKKDRCNYDFIDQRPILKENLEKFLVSCYDIFLDQWNDTKYNKDSRYYEYKLEKNANKLFTSS